MPPPGSLAPPKKGILCVPPPPPPTSSIPSGKNKQRQLSVSTTELPIRPSLVSKGLGSEGPTRSERTRRNLQKLKFECNDMKQITALNRRLASLTIADMSPRLALQRILALYERGDHREAAAFIRRLTYATFRQLVDDLPMSTFVESAMPHSLPILEAIYAKLFLNTGETKNSVNLPNEKYSAENVVWQIVKYFASQDDDSIPSQQPRWEMCGPWVSTCKRLLSVLLTSEPRMKRVVAERRKALTKAIEGLGQHGLVGTSDESLLSLHEALKVQFEVVQKTYSDALAKLDSLKSSHEKSGHGHAGGKAPIAQSHQRQLSLKASEIQERLIKNKSLLNVVEPTLENHSLEVLLGILQRRIELDKEVLFQFTQLKKEIKLLTAKNSSNSSSSSTGVGSSKSDPSVAPLLMRFQRGCQQVLDLMKEVNEDALEPNIAGSENNLNSDGGGSSDNSGYHSDSDSTVMMSGNSPFISKSARYNFLSRSVRSGSKHHLRTSLSVSSSEAAKTGPVTPVVNTNGPSPPTSPNKNNQASVSPSSSGFSSIGNSSCSSGSGSPPDSDTNSHNEEVPRLSGNAVVITRAVINIKSNGDAITEAAKPKIPEPSKPGSVKLTRSRRLNKKTTTSNNTASCVKCDGPVTGNGNSGGNRRQHIYQGLQCRTVLEDISDDDQEDGDTVDEDDEAEKKAVEEELSRLKGCLDRAKNSIVFLKERERKLKDRLQEALQRNAELALAPSGYSANGEIMVAPAAAALSSRSSSTTTLQVIYDVHNGDKRPANLVRNFGDLYSVTRLETLDALDAIQDLSDADELKNKLLFSVVVLSFRSATACLDKIRDQMRRILQLRVSSAVAKEMENAFNTYMRRACDTFDLEKNVEEVTSQIWATLYDYPCLKDCQGLKHYINKCVRVSWGLVNQIPLYAIEYETRIFAPDLHVRFHSADPDEKTIRTYLWPALMEGGKTGPCVHKAVVLT